MNPMFLVVLSLIVALAVSAVMTIRYRRKYTTVVKEVADLRQQVTQLPQDKPSQIPAIQSRKNKPSDPSLMNDEELFQYLRDGILREQLFLSPNFGRSDVVNHFHVPKNRVSAAFSRGSTHPVIQRFFCLIPAILFRQKFGDMFYFHYLCRMITIE